LLWAEAGDRRAQLLDVACGTGFLTRCLGSEITALDQSEAMLAVAPERLPHARLVRGDALALPFGVDAFGRLFTSFFYGHLDPEERRRFLAEARRVGRELIVVDSAIRDGLPPESVEQRVLGDGSCWHVLKRYFSGRGLARELGGGELLHEGLYFIAVAT
jgi:ubiquinone/menaquinone biosynthesis C-methylase UbiE